MIARRFRPVEPHQSQPTSKKRLLFRGIGALGANPFGNLIRALDVALLEPIARMTFTLGPPCIAVHMAWVFARHGL